MANDAIKLLKDDHDKVRKLFKELMETTERGTKTREKLLGQIAREIKIHSTIEEEIFYPAFLDAIEDKEKKKMYYEALEEHHVVDLVLPEVRQADPGSVQFAAKAKVLKELVEHHADEEEKEMFKAARKEMKKEQLQELGERLETRKKQLEKQKP